MTTQQLALTLLIYGIKTVVSQGSCLADSLLAMDMIPSAKISINSSIYLAFTGTASKEPEPSPQGAIRSGNPHENTTVVLNECINFDKCNINLDSIDFDYQYSIGYCGNKNITKENQYPYFQLYLINVAEKYKDQFLIHQKDYNSTEVESFCYDDHAGQIASYSPLQSYHINVNISLNYSIYQFEIHFINRQYNSQLYFGTLSLQINAKYSSPENISTSTNAAGGDSSEYSKEKIQLVNVELIFLILFACVVCCSCIALLFCALYRRKSKQLKHYKKQYDKDHEYQELINITDPMDENGKSTKIETEDEGEMDDPMYTKPLHRTTNQVTEILHFHYIAVDYVEEGDKQGDKPKDGILYHEKQELEMCLMHALNSLLQKQIFDKKKMNEICKELAPKKMINPHKSVLQTGNYDANVLMMALKKINVEVEWFNPRNVKQLNLNDDKFLNKCDDNILVGFILNIEASLLKMVKRRHWIAIKKINGFWYNLDSKLQSPKQYKNTQQLNRFLVNNLTGHNAQLMICRRKKGKTMKKHVKRKAKVDW